MRLNAYLLAADPTWIEAGIGSYYDAVAQIVVSYDRNHRGFTGRPVPVDECLARMRAIDRDGNLIDTMLSPTRDMRAAQRFFRSARSVAGFVPDRVTTDGHNSYPRAIRSTLGRSVRHRTSVYLNNRLEQDHRGIKGRIRCMRGFKEHDAADRFCRELPPQPIPS